MDEGTSAYVDSKKFDCGHVVASAIGGQNVVENLRPVCATCNKSMGTQNMEEFKDIYFKKKYEMLLKYYILYWFRLKKRKIKCSKCLRTLFLMIYNNCDYSKMQLINIRESLGCILSNINIFRASLLSQIELYIYTNNLQISMDAHEPLTIIS